VDVESLELFIITSRFTVMNVESEELSGDTDAVTIVSAALESISNAHLLEFDNASLLKRELV